MPDKPLVVDFKPAPGYILGRPVSREELSQSTTALALPDQVGKLKDSVGIAEVLLLGKLKDDDPAITLKPGDLVAYIPFTDAVIEQGYHKRNVIPYRNVMAISTSSIEQAPADDSGSAKNKRKGNE